MTSVPNVDGDRGDAGQVSGDDDTTTPVEDTPAPADDALAVVDDLSSSRRLLA